MDRKGLVIVTQVSIVTSFTIAAITLVRSIAVLRVTSNADMSLEAALWGRILALPTSFFRRFQSGELAQRILGIETIKQIINGEMPAGIDGSFNLCDVRDLANGAILAADKGERGECYILGNDEVSFRDFAKLLSEESGCKKMKMFIPANLANFIAKIMEKQAKKKGTRPLMTTFAVYNLARNNDFDSSKARRELGYTTRSYRETMRDEIQWLKATGKIA